MDKLQVMHVNNHSNRIEANDCRRPVQQAIESTFQHVDFIFVKSDRIIYKIAYDDIILIESVGDYVKIYTKDRHYVSHFSLKKLETILPERFFPRVHKSYIVSVSKIDSIDGNVIEIKQHKIPIGRNYKHNFLELIQSFGC